MIDRYLRASVRRGQGSIMGEPNNWAQARAAGFRADFTNFCRLYRMSEGIT